MKAEIFEKHNREVEARFPQDRPLAKNQQDKIVWTVKYKPVAEYCKNKKEFKFL